MSPINDFALRSPKGESHNRSASIQDPGLDTEIRAPEKGVDRV